MVDPVTGNGVAELPEIALPAGSSLWEMALHGIGDAPKVVLPAPKRSMVGVPHAPRWMVVSIAVLVLGFIGVVVAMGTSTVKPEPAAQGAPGAPAAHLPGGATSGASTATSSPLTTGSVPSGENPPPVGNPGSIPAAGAPPAAPTCTAHMAWPVPAVGTTDQFTVWGLPPESPVNVVLGYASDPTEYQVTADSTGTATLKITLGDPPVGQPVTVTVTDGAVTCQTSFTPSAGH